MLPNSNALIQNQCKLWHKVKKNITEQLFIQILFYSTERFEYYWIIYVPFYVQLHENLSGKLIL